MPVVTSAQMLDWLDGRNGSSFGNIAYSGGQLSFSVGTNAKARGLEAMLPARSATGPLSKLTRDGQPVSWNRRTVKGVDYVVFNGTAGELQATYANDTTAPGDHGGRRHGRRRGPRHGHVDDRRAVDLAWSSTAAPPRSAARRPTARRSPTTASSSAGSQPDTTYHFRVRSADTAGNTASSPAGAPATFSTAARSARRLAHRRVRRGHARATRSRATASTPSTARSSCSPTVGRGVRRHLAAGPWTMRAFDAGGSVVLGGGSCCWPTTPSRTPPASTTRRA